MIVLLKMEDRYYTNKETRVQGRKLEIEKTSHDQSMEQKTTS